MGKAFSSISMSKPVVEVREFEDTPLFANELYQPPEENEDTEKASVIKYTIDADTTLLLKRVRDRIYDYGHRMYKRFRTQDRNGDGFVSNDLLLEGMYLVLSPPSTLCCHLSAHLHGSPGQDAADYCPLLFYSFFFVFFAFFRLCSNSLFCSPIDRLLLYPNSSLRLFLYRFSPGPGQYPSCSNVQ